MTFLQLLLRVLPWSPLQALKAAWWRATRRRVRAHNILRREAMPLPFAYAYWQRTVEQPAQALAAQGGAELHWQPKFSVIVDETGVPALTQATISSLERQTYLRWELVRPAIDDKPPGTITHGPELAEALANATGDALLLVRAGTELSPAALQILARAMQAQPVPTVLYGDQDSLDDSGRRHSPWFKGEWDPELFLALDYLSDAVVVRTADAVSAARKLGPSATPYRLLLEITRGETAVIVHLPQIIAHVRNSGAGEQQHLRVQAVRELLAAVGGDAQGGQLGTVKAIYPMPAKTPLVSIIIPTKDKLDLLRPCVESVLSKTTYDPFEVIVMDNGSQEPATSLYLAEIAADPRVRVIDHPAPYNFSAINNHAVREAHGEYVCLLNNDTVVFEANWLGEMVRQAVRPETGAVGAKLLYADHTIQHAGVVVGIGGAAGHAHRYLDNASPGYFCMAHVARTVSAVTGACLLVEKRKYLAVGGLDEEQLAIAYNDVDFCLKLQRAGWRNVYVPDAVLLHYESKSRGKDHSPSQIDRYTRELKAFQDRWGTQAYVDPWFNPNLDRESESFVFRLPTLPNQEQRV